MTPKNIQFSENPQNIEIQNFEPPKIAPAYVPWGTDGPKIRISLLLKSEISNISFCLAPLIKVHANCYYQIKGL